MLDIFNIQYKCDEPAILLKVALLHGCSSRFLHCTNGTKSCKALQIK